ncbi:hypothetical protein [Tautonia plasticadhaerens]|uniref:Uncharacterized protein n=1 Tax=Tautonia plasticadhaerens TaxID=2527974 RepID=A0A518H6U9_9BACT|nr:hypothetical protein [Tautonia plasticadhaerens]QDV36609.1 hypothetical protein ElP_45370 [Tautonia plasticadhaerens]
MPTGPVIVLLAMFCGCPEAIAQHCGWYATRPSDEAFDLIVGLSAEALRDGDPDPSRGEPLPPEPCTGPSCSRAPVAPTPSPAPPAPPSVEHWALVGPVIDPVGPDRAPRPRSEPPPRPARPIGGVFHPPRPS